MPHVNIAARKHSELVSLIYEAAVNASRWQAFLHAYVEALRGRSASLVVSTENRNATASFHWSNWPDGDFRLGVNGHRTDDLYRTVGKGQPEGAIRTIDLLCPQQALGQSTAHREFYEPRDARYLFVGVFLRSADTASMIVALREKQDGPFGERAFAILRPLMPHLRQAALVQRELSSLRARLAAFTVYLDRSLFPFVLTDARCRVVYANAAADETTGLKDGIAFASGQLSVMCPRKQAVLIKGIEEVATGRGAELRRLDVERPSRKAPYRLLLMPLPSCAATPLGLSQPVAAVLIIDSEARAELDPEILGELFSLTPAEARVTGKLGVGRNAEEIAAEMGVSLETVRTHIRRVLSKTATGRQGELIALVLRSAPFRRFWKTRNNAILRTET